MPFNGTGTFVRLENWTNDANANLPISATKFDIEDNDFASGLSLCLTRDGQGAPAGTLNWTQRLNLAIAADTVGLSVGRTGGANNPALQVTAVDASGVNLNLTTAQTLALAISGTAVLSIAAALITAAQPIKLANGAVGAPSLTFANQVTDGFYSVAASDIGLAIAGVKAADFSAGQIAAVAPGAAAAALIAAGNGLTLANGFQLAVSAAGVAQMNFGGSTRATISSNGNWSWQAPSSAGSSAFTFTGIANNSVMAINAGATSGQAFGVDIKAGTTTADYAMRVRDQTGTTDYFRLAGTGEVYALAPTVANAGPTNMYQVGFMDLVDNLQNNAYGLVMSDRGKCIRHTAAGAHTYTIPANAGVAFPVGTAIAITNVNGGGVLTIAITTDLLIWEPTGAGGAGVSRTLTAPGTATIQKVSSNAWQIRGSGLS